MNYRALIDNFNQASLHAPTEETVKVYSHIDEINELDNFGNPMVRPLFSHSDLPKVLGLEEIHVNNFDWDENFIYSVMLHHNAELAVEHLNLVPEKVLTKVREKKCILILDNTLEGDTIERFLPVLYKSLDSLKLPYSQIVFISNNLQAETYHKEWVKLIKEFVDNLMEVFDKNNKLVNDLIQPDFIHTAVNVISFPWNIHDVKRLVKCNHLPDDVNIDLEIDYKTKNLDSLSTFLKVNRTGRPERTLSMLYLNHYNILDKCKISFPRLEYIGEFESYLTDSFKEVITDTNIESLKNKTPFDIDSTDKDNHGPPGIGQGLFDADLPFNPIHYRNSFISLIMCAFPHTENACHLHSSTFNPMYCGHPFIAYGPYMHLHTLRELGFKTFNKWWNEDYDLLPHHVDRLKAVLNIVKEISKKSNVELLQMYFEMRDVLQHNSDFIKHFNGQQTLIDKIYHK